MNRNDELVERVAKKLSITKEQVLKIADEERGSQSLNSYLDDYLNNRGVFAKKPHDGGSRRRRRRKHKKSHKKKRRTRSRRHR